MEKIKIYNKENYSLLLSGKIKIVQIQNSYASDEETNHPKDLDMKQLQIANAMTCSYCKTNFDNAIEQRQHYKTDWHRYNIKQNLKALSSLSEDKFEQLIAGELELSSISGSDSESEDDNSEKDNTLRGMISAKMYFKSENDRVFSLYRNILHEKKNAPTCNEAVIKLVRESVRKTYWTILMVGGGHFAAAIFNGPDCVVHKTFHYYTVRAKQGGSQYSHCCAKSAGSALRMQNEQLLAQSVTNLLNEWINFIQKSHLIFYRAAGPFNRSILFGSKSPILKKGDSRLRMIPFSTKRPTYTELKRVYDILTTIEIYDSLNSLKAIFKLQSANNNSSNPESPQRSSRRESSVKNRQINRAKSRELKEAGRPLPGASRPGTASTGRTSSESDNDNNLSAVDVELSFDELKEYEDTVPRNFKGKVAKSSPRTKVRTHKKDRVKKWFDTLKRNLNSAATKGCIPMLMEVLRTIKEDPTEEEDKRMTPSKALNLEIDEHGNTVLHIAALNNHADMITWLLEHDSSPCAKNDKQHTPYTINSDRSIRNVFRNFAREHPKKYNYIKSQIPVITLSEAEIEEKKRAQKKAKREREKEKRKEVELQKMNEDERERFLKLSDREKRALAAERRILAQNRTVLARCFLCGIDISGKVPFEYSGNRFCTVSCLKAHRMNKNNYNY